MNEDRFIATRPFAYHLTSAHNRPLLAELRTLFSTRTILEESRAKAPKVGEKRSNLMTVTFRGRDVVLRDQRPLHKGNMALSGGLRFDDFVALLNSHAFFWPGRSAAGPNDYGRRHAERYADEDVIFLRTPTADLLRSNPGRASVCTYNSGSPRCSGGKASPRGPNTFSPLHDASVTPSKVVELVFPERAVLPASTQWSRSLAGRYQPLFG